MRATLCAVPIVRSIENELPPPTSVASVSASDAAGAAQYIVDGGGYAELENPVTSAAVVASAGGFELGTVIV